MTICQTYYNMVKYTLLQVMCMQNRRKNMDWEKTQNEKEKEFDELEEELVDFVPSQEEELDDGLDL